MTDFPLSRIGVTKVIDTNATLANGSRAANDFDNDTDKADFCDVTLTVTYSVAPAAGTVVGELYVIYGDGESTEAFPEGGSASLGTDDDPEPSAMVGSFTAINPSTSVAEKLQIRDIPLRVGSTNRFVIKNVAGQTWADTWELNITKFKRTAV